MDYTGCRPLSDTELNQMLAVCDGKYASRDRLFLLMGAYTGFRVSEILAIAVRDAWDGTAPLHQVCVAKGFMKGKVRSRTMPLHQKVRDAICQLMKERQAYHPDDPLFTNQRTRKRLSRRRPASIIEKLAVAAEVSTDRLGTHSLRKNFASRMWQHPLIKGDMARMARLLGHVNFSNTLRYLEFTTDLEQAVLTG